MDNSGNFLNRMSGSGGGNNRTWLYVILAVAVVCILCVAGVGVLGLIGIRLLPELTNTGDAQPTQAVQTSSSYIQEIVMARDVSGDMMDPVDPTTVFAPSDTIHAVVKIADAPSGTRFKAIWLVDDVGGAVEPNTNIAEYELEAEGSRNLDFTLSPNNQWPVGRYRAEIYVNDDLAQTVYYDVSE